MALSFGSWPSRAPPRSQQQPRPTKRPDVEELQARLAKAARVVEIEANHVPGSETRRDLGRPRPGNHKCRPGVSVLDPPTASRLAHVGIMPAFRCHPGTLAEATYVSPAGRRAGKGGLRASQGVRLVFVRVPRQRQASFPNAGAGQPPIVRAVSDRWAEWLRVRRDGGSPEQRREALKFLGPIRDRILDAADLRPGDVVLDVGCGDGLVGLGALDRGAQVIFSDISEECLNDCRRLAGDAASYHRASVTDLGAVTADVVTTRSVLIYVADKERAFGEFFRVLRPGGRLSIFEPINRFGLKERNASYGFIEIAEVADLMAKVVAEVSRAEEDAGGLDPMVDFDERDLIRLAEVAGFDDIQLDLTAEVRNTAAWRPRDWNVFLDSSPNPLAPTFREAMQAALTPDEQERLTPVLRAQVEQGRGTTRFARAFLTARKAA